MKYISALFLLIYLCACKEQPPLKTGLEGKLLPSFNLLLNDSATYFNTGNIPTGKPIVLFYFSPKCPYCRTEMNEIIENINRLSNIHFYLITRFPFSEMKQFYTEYKLSQYSNITIGYDSKYFFGNYFQTPGVPYMAIYGLDKRLKKAYIGLVKSSDIKEVTNE